MGVVSAITVFFCIWWVVIFTVLPLNLGVAETQVKGAMPGAPQNANIKKKFILATAITFVLWLIVLWLVQMDVFSFREWAKFIAE